jgi:hypothetical protein
LIFEPGIGVRRGSNTVEARDFQIDGVPSGETCLFSINI